ncbi:MAG: hemerythrin domain-containing protein [Prevotellaceae bacterium]|jgi:regulator of cell morphogenesis and NO signaling|nr:hemerythrin domain-containing protein [Prevotellaceae bacterium]
MYEINTNISGNSRLTNLIIEYPNLLSVLEYFNISLGLGDKTVAEIALEYNIAPNTFEVVIQVYCKETPSKVLSQEEIPDLLRFLQASHNHFKDSKIPELKGLIELFSKEIPTRKGKVLVAFFDEYIKEVDAHFLYEDEKVFPYINNVLCNRREKNFKIREFERNHTDIEQKLRELKKILIRDIPPSVVSKYRKQILINLINLAQDLTYHTQIEDNILVPFVKNMETNIKN